MRTPGIYKDDDKFITQVFKDGMVVSMVINPMFDDIEEFEKLPNGYKFPEHPVKFEERIEVYEQSTSTRSS